MRHIGRFPLQLAVCVALGILCTRAALCGNTKINLRFVGVYESEPPHAGRTAPSISISLGEDATATVTQDPGNSETTSFGHWEVTGNQIVVTFDAQSGKPAEPAMTFQPSHDGLQAVTWNHAQWGKVTPPLAKKSSGNWHKKPHWWSPS